MKTKSTVSLIADTLLDPKQTLSRERVALNATLILSPLSNSADPEDWERVKRLSKLIAEYANECAGRVIRDAGHPLDGAA